MTVLMLDYAAELVSIDTNQPASPHLLALCEGTRETTFEPMFVAAHALPDDVKLVAAAITLHVRDALVMTVQLTTDRPVPLLHHARIASVLENIFESDWNYEFDLPEALNDYQVHFASRPSVAPLDADESAIAALARLYPHVTFEQISALSDAALDELLARLMPIAASVRYNFATPDRSTVRSLLEAAETQKQRRAVDRLARDRSDDEDVF